MPTCLCTHGGEVLWCGDSAPKRHRCRGHPGKTLHLCEPCNDYCHDRMEERAFVAAKPGRGYDAAKEE